MTLLDLIEQEIDFIGEQRDIRKETGEEIVVMNREIHFLKTLHWYLSNPDLFVRSFSDKGISVKVVS